MSRRCSAKIANERICGLATLAALLSRNSRFMEQWSYVHGTVNDTTQSRSSLTSRAELARANVRAGARPRLILDVRQNQIPKTMNHEDHRLLNEIRSIKYGIILSFCVLSLAISLTTIKDGGIVGIIVSSAVGLGAIIGGGVITKYRK